MPPLRIVSDARARKRGTRSTDWRHQAAQIRLPPRRRRRSGGAGSLRGTRQVDAYDVHDLAHRRASASPDATIAAARAARCRLDVDPVRDPEPRKDIIDKVAASPASRPSTVRAFSTPFLKALYAHRLRLTRPDRCTLSACAPRSRVRVALGDQLRPSLERMTTSAGTWRASCALMVSVPSFDEPSRWRAHRSGGALEDRGELLVGAHRRR